VREDGNGDQIWISFWVPACAVTALLLPISNHIKPAQVVQSYDCNIRSFIHELFIFPLGIMTTIALTTTFTPPSSCSDHWTYEGSFYNSVSNGLLMQNVLSESLDTDCFPTGFTNNGRVEGTQIYSPGACPVGYATAVSQNGATTTAVCCLQYVTLLIILTP
jgi:hypothetical protein